MLISQDVPPLGASNKAGTELYMGWVDPWVGLGW